MISSRVSKPEWTTDSHGPWASKFPVQASRIFCWHTRFAWECHRHGIAHTKDARDEASPHQEASRGGHVSVVFEGEDAENFIIFMDRLTKVASFLFVVPIAIWVAVLSLDSWGIDVVIVLQGLVSLDLAVVVRSPCTISGSSTSWSALRHRVTEN